MRLIKNKPYANSNFGDIPALSRIFNTPSQVYGPSVYKPPHTNSTKSLPI